MNEIVLSAFTVFSFSTEVESHILVFSMLCQVFRTRHECQVLYSVVQLIMIFVVDVFFGEEGST